jgi:predicted nuclease of predicted toxin-antitoxin system
MRPYKFLFDNNCEKAALLFPKRRTITLKQAGLTPKAPDRQIVEVACANEWIIVTVNGDDFISEFNRYLKQTKKSECHDLYGLVILPSDHEVQRQTLRHIEDKLMFESKHISWKEVWNLDCCVRVARNSVRVIRFERCFYCKKNRQK